MIKMYRYLNLVCKRPTDLDDGSYDLTQSYIFVETDEEYKCSALNLVSRLLVAFKDRKTASFRIEIETSKNNGGSWTLTISEDGKPRHTILEIGMLVTEHRLSSGHPLISVFKSLDVEYKKDSKATLSADSLRLTIQPIGAEQVVKGTLTPSEPLFVYIDNILEKVLKENEQVNFGFIAPTSDFFFEFPYLEGASFYGGLSSEVTSEGIFHLQLSQKKFKPEGEPEEILAFLEKEALIDNDIRDA